MSLHRTAAILASAVLLAGLTACTATPDPEADARGPSADDSTSTEELADAVSEPVEDSVYPDVGDPSVDSLHYDLDLTWDPDSRTLTGDEELTFRSTATADHVQLDLGEALELSAVQVDGVATEYEHAGKDLVVSGEFVEDEHYVLTVAYSGTPEPVTAPTTRRDFENSGFTIAPDGSAWTMQEPYGAFTWYAVNDQPADKAFYDFTLHVPAPWTGVANGVMASREEDDGSTVTEWHLDSTTSSYLVTVAFGDYKVTQDESPSGVPISYWVPTSSASSTDGLSYTPEALDWVESKLGPYPWSSLGILLVDSTSGMETQTMITLGDTDYTTANDTLVHEIVHQWYGDQVTPEDWRDLWMNEGMAMYLQFVWQSETTGEPLEQILQVRPRYERISRRTHGPPAAYDPQAFGETQVYYGPALMWDLVRRRVGDDAFWAMVRDWPSYDQDGIVGREEYLPWVEEHTGAELSDLFDGWLLAKRSPKFETAG